MESILQFVQFIICSTALGIIIYYAINLNRLHKIYYRDREEMYESIPMWLSDKINLNKAYKEYYTHIIEHNKECNEELLTVLVLIENLNKILPHRKYLFTSNMTVESLNKVYFDWRKESKELLLMNKVLKQSKYLRLFFIPMVILLILEFIFIGFNSFVSVYMTNVIILTICLFVNDSNVRLRVKSLANLIYNTDYCLDDLEKKNNMDFLLLKLLKVSKNDDIINLLQEKDYNYDILEVENILNFHTSELIRLILNEQDYSEEMSEFINKIKYHLIGIAKSDSIIEKEIEREITIRNIK